MPDLPESAEPPSQPGKGIVRSMADVFVDHIIACDYCRSFPSKLCIQDREMLQTAMAEKALASR
jgi:hypothetical protein